MRGADGSARVLQVPAARRGVTIAGIPRTIAGTVSLRARRELVLAGLAARARFAATAKPVDRFLPLSELRR